VSSITNRQTNCSIRRGGGRGRKKRYGRKSQDKGLFTSGRAHIHSRGGLLVIMDSLQSKEGRKE